MQGDYLTGGSIQWSCANRAAQGGKGKVLKRKEC